MELVQPKRQHAWAWPVVANFTLGGMAAGFYLLNVLVETFQGNMPDRYQTVVFKLLPPLLVGLGFICLTIEAGRPMRGIFLLNNLRSSWMSREMVIGAVFILSAVLDTLFPHAIIEISALCSAAGLIISHGFIFYRAVAVRTWNEPLIPVHFFTSALSMGFGLLLLLGVCSNDTLGMYAIVTGMICVLINQVIWLMYLRVDRVSSFHTEEASGSPVYLTMGIKHLLPILLLLPLLLIPAAQTAVSLRNVLSVLAGLFLAVEGVRQKVTIILGASDLRGIVIGHLRNSVQDFPRHDTKVGMHR